MHFDNDSGWYTDKKNIQDPLDEEHETYSDIAEAAVDELFTEPDTLVLQTNYLGTVDAKTLTKCVNIKRYIQMLEDDVYLKSIEGLQFSELLDNYFDESFSNYVVETEPFVNALKNILEIEEDLTPPTFI